ncbi:MAG: hypothetical protein AVDCRST_MAG93-5563 [uncultured Chloroflexia bacterium]|uniref:Uncharacterized protein n=1 Tax=uncultured Chloroflexia bacterium TaxID=1672391 RepID=A0A6J4KY37_9CHLR|nr:MAG: hypothetical protein AVDCRST_MAG93-5563 [uncultured Chloroflexia bacterium]
MFPKRAVQSPPLQFACGDMVNHVARTDEGTSLHCADVMDM